MKLKLKKKYIILEVETTMSNKGLKDKGLWTGAFLGYDCKVIQVQVNLIKPDKK